MVITTSGVIIRQSRQSYWRKRTKCEQCAIITIPICSIIIIILITNLLLIERTLTVAHFDSIGISADPVCLTPGCIQAAARILNSLDQSINPCDNFYDFACGGYLKSNQIPNNALIVDARIETEEAVQHQLRSILEETTKSEELRSHKLYKTMYNSCMNTTAIEVDSINSMKTIIKDLGGWPVLEANTWNDKKFDWQKSIFKFRKFGLSTNNFITFSVIPHPQNSSKNILHLGQATLELNMETLSNKTVEAYFNYMVELSIYFGANISFAQSEVLDVIKFKTDFAQISIIQAEKKNITMTIQKLQEKYPKVSWLNIINYVVSLPDRVLKYDSEVVVENTDYLVNLVILLQTTSKRVQANYAIFQALRSLSHALPENLRDMEEKFNKKLYGISSVVPRWKQCVAVSSSVLKWVAGSLYVKKYFDEQTKYSAKEIVQNVKKEFIKSISNFEWIDNDTKTLAIQKFNNINISVGYPKREYLDDKKIDDYYANLKTNTTSYLQFYGNFSLFKTDKIFQELFHPTDELNWKGYLSPTSVNTYFLEARNSIDIPAAILQKPLIYNNGIQAVNYGAIGSIIGYELSQVFDKETEKYGKLSKLKNWWKKSTKLSDDEKMLNCSVYRDLSFTEKKVHFEKMENSDYLNQEGIKHAYLAYQSLIQENGVESQLPGLNYTAQQFFWIFAANHRCKKEIKQFSKPLIPHQNHLSILLPFSTLEYFSKDFMCALGSNMNPYSKCSTYSKRK